MPSRTKTPTKGEPTNFPMLKEMERENRKNLFINAAERVFTEMPFDKVTIRNIAKQAGITATAIYRYFPDKQTLYAEAYIRSNDRLLGKILEMMNSHTSLCLEEITMVIIEHFMSEEQNLKMRAHFLIDDSLSPEIAQSINESSRRFISEIVNYFGRFSPDVDARLLSRIYVAALNGLLITLRKYPGKNQKEVLQNMKAAGSVLASMFQNQLNIQKTKK